jgi:hypothetical protein
MKGASAEERNMEPSLFALSNKWELEHWLFPFIENPFQVRNRSVLVQAKWRHELKNPQKGAATLLEASHHHLLITPPSHFAPQKVKGLFGWLTHHGRELHFR